LPFSSRVNLRGKQLPHNNLIGSVIALPNRARAIKTMGYNRLEVYRFEPAAYRCDDDSEHTCLQRV
jgi:hypothetical protein